MDGRDTLGNHSKLKHRSLFDRFLPFCFLVITTGLSTTLLIANINGWAIGGEAYGWWFQTILNNRAEIQSAIQVCAATLGLIHASAVATLVQHATSLGMLNGAGFTAKSLRARINMSILRWQWGGKVKYVVPVLGLCSLGLVSSALWVGAITPVSDTMVYNETLLVPSFANTTLIREYPAQINESGPSITTREGHFTYSVGVKLLGNIIASGATATTSDNSTRRHPKIDNTQFIYQGRSYGVGAGVGITDDSFASMQHSTSYRYWETGYVSEVRCIHNSSTDFKIGGEVGSRIFPVQGNLPDSRNGAQYSDYFGYSADAIVALGVAYSTLSERRYMAIAAGESYHALNTAQCTVDWTPTKFEVNVDLTERSISVEPVEEVQDFDPDRNLTRTAMRQFELISNDLTNLYESVLGNSFLSSIAAWNISNNAEGLIPEDTAALRGLENAITAMSDSIVGAYGAAQLMVGDFSQQQEVELTVMTFAIGQEGYIIAVVVLNAIIMLVVIEEAIRTRGWKGLPAYDFTNPEWVMTAAYLGGTMNRKPDAEEASGQAHRRSWMPWRYSYYMPKAGGRSWLKAVPFGNGEVALRLKEGPP